MNKKQLIVTWALLILFLSLPCLAKTETTHLADYYNELGIKAGEAKDYDNAIKYFQKAIKTDSKYASAYINLGRTYGLIGEYNKAIDILNRVIKLKLHLQAAYINLGAIYEKMKNYDKAIEYAQKALLLGSKNPIANYNLGYVYLKKKDRAGATRQCDILRKIGETALADSLESEISRKMGK